MVARRGFATDPKADAASKGAIDHRIPLNFVAKIIFVVGVVGFNPLSRELTPATIATWR